MAAIWKGSISFGLVSVPIELRQAVRSDHISFRLLHGKDNTPVRYQRVREDNEKEVPWKEVVKGYEYEKGEFVILTDKDFEAAALKKSDALDIEAFVDADEIDPRFFETPYFALPTKAGTKAYTVLREAMRQSNVVAIGRIILRQKQHLAGLHVTGDSLVVEIMRFANEIVPASEYDFPAADTAKAAEIDMGVKLVASLHTSFEPEQYTDQYRANLLRIIEAKSTGKKATLPEAREAPGGGRVLDLMAKLEASLKRTQAAGKDRADGASRRSGIAARAKAKQAAAKERRRKTA
ncbi:MAG: non-homologous end joining protein Ku [Gemmatimonadaceae bacterium]